MDHHIRYRKFAQIEHAAEHIAVERFDVTFAMQQIDGSAQFLARRQHLLIVAHRHADVLEQPSHQRLDGHQHRAEQFDEQKHRPRNRQRNPVGRVECRRFRQNLGKHDDDDRHHHGGVDDTGIAKPGQQHARCQRRGGDVDCIVAEQQRAEQPLALFQQTVDDAGAAVSVFLQPRHAGARRRGQRRFTAGKEGREQQADQTR